MTDDLRDRVSSQELDEAAELLKQWKILGSTTGPVQIGTRYQLKNRTIRKFLQYENQGSFGGINLGWTDDAEPATAQRVTHWRFVRAGGQGSLKYGEHVAIAWKDDYIYYGDRTVGINLKWSDSPVQEWQVLGGLPGTPVQTSDWVSLFNTRSEGGAPLIFFDRTRGGDIGWPGSRTWGEQLKDLASETAKKAIVEYLKSGKSK
ncbi:MAG TPA: hypothetical protein VK453_08200 [Micromonosporaceae bacterium]|nr:hypothetical protein [Micromonosporaceae bacterium]